MLMMCIGPEMEIPSPKATCVRKPNGAFALQAAACVTLFVQGAAAYSKGWRWDSIPMRVIYDLHVDLGCLLQRVQ